MDNETLVQIITAEVLRLLGQRKAEPSIGEPARKVVAIFTGGTIGLEQGLQELKKLQERNVQLTVILSAAAEQVVGVTRVTNVLGSHIEVVTSQCPYPGRRLREADLVIVPVLTQNTAAKLAHTLSDTLVSTVILQALMMGKSVLAASNAADPQEPFRVQKEMAKSPPALLQALQGNLKKIAGFGIRLMPVDQLASEAKSLLHRHVKSETDGACGKRKVIDAEAVKKAAADGTNTLCIAKGWLVTPLARDLAREYGLDFIEDK